jgi:uncharacterized membrane protein YdbT with pleckstrin-like domain
VSYVQTILRPDENVLAIGRMHWIVFVRGALILLLALVAIFLPVPEGWYIAVRIIGFVLLVVALYQLFVAWFERWTTEIAVTNLRVIQKRGFIRRVTGEMNMEKVESVIVDQSLLGRLLNYGSIVVRGTGSGIEGLHHIADPIGLRSAIVVR